MYGFSNKNSTRLSPCAILWRFVSLGVLGPGAVVLLLVDLRILVAVLLAGAGRDNLLGDVVLVHGVHELVEVVVVIDSSGWRDDDFIIVMVDDDVVDVDGLGLLHQLEELVVVGGREGGDAAIIGQVGARRLDEDGIDLVEVIIDCGVKVEPLHVLAEALGVAGDQLPGSQGLDVVLVPDGSVQCGREVDVDGHDVYAFSFVFCLYLSIT